MTFLMVKGRADRRNGAVQGTVAVPGDKSISHRALMLGALAEGSGRVEGFLPSGDCLATLASLRQLGIEIEHATSGAATTLIIQGRGLRGLRPPEAQLDCRRSGTTMRLLAGILAGQAFGTVLGGAPQLLRRPMRRVTEPLRRMGARIRDTEGHAPLFIDGVEALQGGNYPLAVASAQVKSALLLAGLYAREPVTVLQPGPARDHTERMLAAQIEPRSGAGPALTFDVSSARLDPTAIDRLRAIDRTIPGDISSAAFPLAAALLLPDSEVTLTGIGVNPTRTGLLDVLSTMGAEITVHHERIQGGEPVADLTVCSSALTGTEVGGDLVVRMIDEFPILAVLATQARGRTVVRDAAELRVKETDRILNVVTELRTLGAAIEPCNDGFVVEGPTRLQGAEVNSQGDHRLAMALGVAGLIAEGDTTVLQSECIPDSFPGFVETMRVLGARISHGI
jgi:3-phosphoshikimate 1-carboxyvinyltransferase